MFSIFISIDTTQNVDIKSITLHIYKCVTFLYYFLRHCGQRQVLKRLSNSLTSLHHEKYDPHRRKDNKQTNRI